MDGAEQAAPHDPRTDPGAGLRHLGLQDRRRRAGARGRSASRCSTPRRRRACRRPTTQIDAVIVETKSGRCAVRGRMFIDGSGDGDLAAWAGVPYESRRRRGQHALPVDDVPDQRRRPGKAGRAWELIPTLMDEAESAGPPLPRKKPIVRPQRNPIEWRANLTQIKNPDGTRGRAASTRDSSPTARSRAAGSAGTCSVHQAADAGLRGTPTSSRSRRRSASARPAGCAANTAHRGRHLGLRRLPRRDRRQRLAGRGARRRRRGVPCSRGADRAATTSCPTG